MTDQQWTLIYTYVRERLIEEPKITIGHSSFMVMFDITPPYYKKRFSSPDFSKLNLGLNVHSKTNLANLKTQYVFFAEQLFLGEKLKRKLVA
jgi:hypothetical protein